MFNRSHGTEKRKAWNSCCLTACLLHPVSCICFSSQALVEPLEAQHEIGAGELNLF